jgi:hypothetical protein
MYVDISNLANVNTVIYNWNRYFEKVMDITFPKVICKLQKKKNRWFDNECCTLRTEIVECENSQQRFILCKRYKTLCQQKKRNYKIQTMSKLDNACTNDSVQFWKMVNSLSGSSNANCNLDPGTNCDEISALSSMPEQEYFDKEFEEQCGSFIDSYLSEENLEKFKFALENQILMTILLCLR